MIITNTDSEICAREQIQSPGTIQPYGMMIVATLIGLQVKYVAGDVEGRLGLHHWPDTPLRALLGETLIGRVDKIRQHGSGGFIGQLRAHPGRSAGQLFDVSAHASDTWMIVELEHASAEQIPNSFTLDALTEGAANFERAPDIQALCERAAVAFRELTRFDHVMVYRFVEGNAGQVVAEDRRAGSRSFLNQHFPASDIPAQARALYLRNRIRVIADRDDQPQKLRPEWQEPTRLDMSDSALRSVSPLHLTYLANMGVRASASMSIVSNKALWGLIACHNDTRRTLPYDIRAACCMLAASLGRQIKTKQDVGRYERRIQMRGFEDDIIRAVIDKPEINTALANHLPELRLMLDADGVAILHGDDLAVSGACPTGPELRELCAWIARRPDESIFATEHLSCAFAPAADYESFSSGLLAIPFAGERRWYLLCFRASHAQTVTWAGNPHKAAGVEPHTGPTPRKSFEAWKGLVRGHARPWTNLEIEASNRLRATLLDAERNRRLRFLNSSLTITLKDKETLLRHKAFLMDEINRRLQNSLQLVSSFLALESENSNSPAVTHQLAEAKRRLDAVALVHRRLYANDQIEMVELAPYIDALCHDTLSIMGRDWAQHLSLDLAPIAVTTDQAIAIGMVLTELLINCKKFAYDGAAGPIEVTLTEKAGYLCLVVADHGKASLPVPAGFSTGIMIDLLGQIGGDITNKPNHPGLRVEIGVRLNPA